MANLQGQDIFNIVLARGYVYPIVQYNVKRATDIEHQAAVIRHQLDAVAANFTGGAILAQTDLINHDGRAGCQSLRNDSKRESSNRIESSHLVN